MALHIDWHGVGHHLRPKVPRQYVVHHEAEGGQHLWSQEQRNGSHFVASDAYPASTDYSPLVQHLECAETSEREIYFNLHYSYITPVDIVTYNVGNLLDVVFFFLWEGLQLQSEVYRLTSFHCIRV